MGAGGEDIMLSPAARKYVPFNIECKSKDKIAVYAFLDQAKEHGNYTPLAVVKQNHREPIVIIDAEEFFKLLRKVIIGHESSV